MHEEQVDVRPQRLRRLLAAQLPELADLPIERVPSSGTDNTIYRLGQELVVRLPLIEWAVRQVALEHEWLPRLRGHVPVELPQPLAMGAPGEGYPWPWSVYRWLEGANPAPEDGLDQGALAVELAGFLRALRSIDPTDVPRSSRGGPLRLSEEAIRGAIARVHDQLDTEVLTAVLDDALAAPRWDGPWVPVHADLSGGNLLLRAGRLHAVIDFSCFGLGDPANDIDVAWELFDEDHRATYRQALEVDDATWRRARGWAVRSVIGLPYYEHTNPGIVARARRRLDNVIADWHAGA
jgi:aminoglycoside phosphotransferase (APT) family kinase protein